MVVVASVRALPVTMDTYSLAIASRFDS